MAPAKPSFRSRFHAWWEGYDLPDDDSASKPGDVAGIETGAGAGADAPDRAGGDAAADEGGWTQARVNVVQRIFGPGFNGPGGAEEAVRLAQTIGLDTSANLLEIGAGFGGSTRAIANELGAYVTGFDSDRAVASEGIRQAKYHDIQAKATVAYLDLNRPDLRADRYHGALVRETLYRVREKESFLAAIADALKPAGRIVISDLFVSEEAGPTVLEQWHEGDSVKVYPIDIVALRELLPALGIDVRITEDETEVYCAAALQAWTGFLADVEAQAPPPEEIIPMVREVNRWANRIAALRAGDVKVYRLVGIKSGDPD